MPKKKYYESKYIDRLQEELHKAIELKEFKKILSLLIPLKLKITLKETAELIGASEVSVNRMRQEKTQEMKTGIRINKGKWGGRRRENMSIEEEKRFLGALESKAGEGGYVDTNEIMEVYRKKLGKAVPRSCITRLLYRHGWRKIAPRKYHPKRDLEAQEEFKKTLER